VAREVVRGLVLGVKFRCTRQFRLHNEHGSDIVAGPEGVDQGDDSGLLAVRPALAADTLLSRWATGVAAGSTYGTARVLNAQPAQAACVAARAFQRTATLAHALHVLRAALLATGAFGETAGVAQAGKAFRAAGASALSRGWAAHAVSACFAQGATHCATNLGGGTAAAWEAGLLGGAAAWAAYLACATADPGVARFPAEAARVAANRFIRAARLVVQAPLL
jgi:hypothetical protein